MAAYELKYTAEEIDGILESVDEKTIYDDATQSAHGLMSVEDKTKLDGLPDGEELSEALDSKIGKRVPTTAGNLAKLTGDGNIADSGYRIDDFATEQQGRLANTAYQKPSTGIPASDLASSVQTSLGKADTALQEHQDISGKQDTLVSGTNIKTVNGESLLGSGNIEIQGGGGGGEENVIEAITMNGASVPVTNKTAAITETDPTVPSWAKQPNKPSYNYSEIGNTPDLSGFITNTVNNLTNYYLKSETYTKAEVAALIGAIQQFHYEFYASTSAVTNPQGNVLYLIGPTGSGSDRYEEYVYSNNAFVKIGDTSIDLSGYVTTSALNTALAGYTPTSNLATVATSGSYNDLTNKPTIPTVPVQDVTVGGTSVVSGGVAVVPAIPDVSGKEDTSNKVTSFQSTPDDTHYPSEKLVKDSLDDKLDISDVEEVSAVDVDSTPTASSANLVTSGGVYDAIHPAISTTEPSVGMLPNMLYKLGTLSGSVTIALATPSDANIENEYKFTFTADSTAPTITWPLSVTSWIGNSLDNNAPKVEAGNYYEVSVLDGCGIFNKF